MWRSLEVLPVTDAAVPEAKRAGCNGTAARP
jgi:hypothetical protein